MLTISQQERKEEQEQNFYFSIEGVNPDFDRLKVLKFLTEKIPMSDRNNCIDFKYLPEILTVTLGHPSFRNVKPGILKGIFPNMDGLELQTHGCKPKFIEIITFTKLV